MKHERESRKVIPQTADQRRLFGTDGIRGVANTEPMTAELALQVGKAVAHIIRSGSHRHKIVKTFSYIFQNNFRHIILRFLCQTKHRSVCSSDC